MDNFNASIMELIGQVLQKRGMNYSQLARLINVTPSSVQKMFSGKAMSLDRLRSLSQALDYNFFAAIAMKEELPNYQQILETPEREKELEKKVFELEIENRTLIKLLKPES